MNKIFILFIVILYFFTKTEAQKTIEIDKQWNVVDYKVFTPNICTDLYSFKKDTIINSQEYLELYTKRDTSNSINWHPTGIFIREDSLNRIYILENGVDKILYDFNLVQNDTFQLNIDYYDCELVVYQVDTIQLLNGEWRKRIRLIRSDDPNPNQPWYGYKDWIQGIGSSTSLYRYIESCYTDYPLDLLCHFENGNIVYSNPNNQGCFITPVNEISDEEHIQIYPNPATIELNIKSENQILNIKMFSMDGKLKLYENAKSALNLKNLTPGFYLVQIETTKGITISKIAVN